ncbi:MAG TPA: bifunctional sulfate adenylyltransferase/adenylylsulfate kinase [Pyrinomonadaceae bacterium]|nr:bifunctional sulfate adenylyltransferase/adenylylsulfate kinase [Pyrinomonadaceae bacterium]
MIISPYKGQLVDLVAAPEIRADLFAYAAGLRSIQLTQRQTCDLELLATGAFSPLCSFMGESDYESVIDNMRLADGTVFPIPVTLGVDDLTDLGIGGGVALRDPKNDLLAVMKISEIYEWDREVFAMAVAGTADSRHPLVAEMSNWGRFNLSGELRVLKLPEYQDFRDLRLTPRQTRRRLEAMERSNVVAFQTRNPIHRAHEVMTRRAIEMTGGALLLHPVVGMTRPGDVDYSTRVRTYKAVADLAYRRDRVLLAILPLAMRLAGPREAVWHAIIRRNYGANHLIVGRDHASPGTDGNGEPFYKPDAAQKLAVEMGGETGVKILSFQEFAYLPEERRYEEVDKISPGRKVITLSGTKIREDFLARGRQLPDWFTRPEISQILSEAYPPRDRKGVCVWFTGLSGAGKSTTAEILSSILSEEGRQTTLLDGDVVRTHLSKGLGFSREDRDINVARIGFVASEIVRHGGIAICAAVSPYRQARDQVRQMFADGQFIEIFVDTPLEVCEGRDAKGMYAKARRGEIKHFTGIDDAYEPPESAELILDTRGLTADQNARLIVAYLRGEGFLTQVPTPLIAHDRARAAASCNGSRDLISQDKNCRANELEEHYA